VADQPAHHPYPLWEHTMSQPDVDEPIDSWGLIFHGSGLYRVAHTRQDWACIADAIATADRRLADAAPAVLGQPPFVRGDATWCAHAVDTYQMLTAAGAYWHLRPGDEPDCAADEHLIRAYFAAPWVPPTDPPQTMLDASGWGTSFDPAYPVDPTSPIILASVAQDLGLLGGPDHRVSLWRATDHNGDYIDGFTVTVRASDRTGWASAHLSTQDLMPAGAAPVDAIVAVLTCVAGVANRLLATHRSAATPVAAAPDHQRDGPPPNPLPAHVQGYPIGNRSRGFPPLNGATPSTPDNRTAAAPPSASRRHR
jgi:hypothetical protein